MDKRRVLRLMAEVREVASKQIAGTSRDAAGYVGRGLASEGYVGGYIAAIDDIDAMLRHGHPSDRWGFWRGALERSGRRRTKCALSSDMP
jgi:hypothetical protein